MHQIYNGNSYINRNMIDYFVLYDIKKTHFDYEMSLYLEL